MEITRGLRRLQWLAKISGRGLIGGGLLAVAFTGVVYGVHIDRTPPRIYSLQVVGEVHAGSDMRIREEASVPENCLPRITRKLVHGPDALSNGKPVTQIITDSVVVADGGDILIPLPPDVPTGQWRFYETISTQACGALSGVLPPLVANAHGADGNIGVVVTILPRMPILTKIEP